MALRYVSLYGPKKLGLKWILIEIFNLNPTFSGEDLKLKNLYLSFWVQRKSLINKLLFFISKCENLKRKLEIAEKSETGGVSAAKKSSVVQT